MRGARVAPVKVRSFDAALDVDVQRIVGYKVRCPCGWPAPTRDSYAEARHDLHEHNRDTHADPPR